MVLLNKATFIRRRTNFWPAKDFDNTLRSQGTVNIIALFTRKYEQLGVEILLWLRCFRVNGTPRQTDFQPVENSSGAVWIAVFTLETDNPSSKSVKINGKTDGKSQAHCSSKLRPFHFQIKTYYLSDANYPTDNPSLVWIRAILAHQRLKAATLVVIILYRMNAFHLLGQIVYGLSKKKARNLGLVNFYSWIAFKICTNQFYLPKNGRESVTLELKTGLNK